MNTTTHSRPVAPTPAPAAPSWSPAAVPAETSRFANRYLERAALQARLQAGGATTTSTARIDTASVMAALLSPVDDGARRDPVAASPAPAVRRTLTPLPGARLLAVDVVPAEVRFDGAELARLLHELVDNARRHAPPGSTVRVRGAEGPTGYQLSVTNTGEPLPRWVLAALRQDVRAGSATDPAGLCLGLSIASLLAALNGCRLEVLRGAGRPNTLRVIVPPG